MKGRVFDTPEERLSFPRWRTQQCAIAATHQREAALNQANGPITQIVRLPVALGNAPGAEQDFRDFSIGTAVHARVERAKGERHSLTAVRGKRMQRRPRRPAVQGSPQAPACIRAELKVAVEWKFDSILDCNDGCFLKPDAMLYAVQMQHGVPTIRALP